MSIEPTNENRAHRAAVALAAYGRVDGIFTPLALDRDDLETLVADLLADLHHLVALHLNPDDPAGTVETLVERGCWHYSEEVAEAAADDAGPRD